MKVARCSSCQAEILWAISNASGSRIPIDAQPATFERPPAGTEARGLFVLVKRLEDAPLAWTIDLTNGGGDTMLARKVALYRSHFATCPDAAQHRRSR